MSSSGRGTSALVRIPDSSWTLRRFRKVPNPDKAEIGAQTNGCSKGGFQIQIL
jgi:hypothetical protein